ncbi:MAG TPA: restriction endonuclease subunit S [Actinomycetota bacterium]|nr:restriction endonuclease subunit S [Actinomycetota bacterium]
MSRWPTIPLGELCTINPRLNASERPAPETAVTFVPMAAVDEVEGRIFQSEVRTYKQVAKGYTPFKEDDVLFAKITPCMQNGKSAIAHGLVNGLGFGSTEFHVLRPGPDVLPEWLWHFVRQQSFREEARRHFRGSAGQQRVPATFVEQHEIPLPSLAEQRRIVGRIEECLERVGEIRRLRFESRREAAAVFPSLLADHFWGLADRYSVATISDVALETKYGTSRKCHRDERGTPVLRIPNVSGGAIDVHNLKFCDELSEKEVATLLLRDGDLLVVRTNGSRDLVGRCAVFNGKERSYAYASYLIRIRPDRDRVHPQFLAFFLESTMGRDAIAERRRTSAGQFNINSKNLRTIAFPCPPLDVQHDLVEEMVHHRRVVNEIVAVPCGMEEQDAALQQAVLRKAFGGEL